MNKIVSFLYASVICKCDIKKAAQFFAPLPIPKPFLRP